jgi:hypothetical protein
MSGRALYAQEAVTIGSSGNSRTYTHQVGPRLTPQEIFDFNRDANTCITTIERNEGLTRTHGYFPTRVDWPLTEHEYILRSRHLAWPADSDETLTITPPWPEQTAHTILPTHHPLPAPHEASSDVVERLSELWETLGP